MMRCPINTRPLNLWAALALGLLLVGALAGCPSGAFKTTNCNGPGDCPPGQTCGPDHTCVPVDAGNGDSMGFVDGGGCPSGVICAGTCCPVGEVCDGTRCVAPVDCVSDDDCLNDTYCHESKCIPWGTGPKGGRDEACTQLVPIGLFSPAEQCRWTGPPAGDPHPNHVNVLGTPVVVDFDLDGDPATRRPSIVFVSYDGQDGGSAAAACANGFFGVIRVIDGATCAQQHSLATAQVRAASPLAAGDLDGDGVPEIVASRCGGGLVAYSYNSQQGSFELLWTSDPPDVLPLGNGWIGPAIHDLDDDGKPEILLWGTVWSNTGQLLDQSLDQSLDSEPVLFPVVADIDGDGQIELVNGAGVWRFGGGSWNIVHPGTGTAGHTAVADFGTYGADPSQDDRSQLDGVAEIVVVGDGKMRIQTAAGRVIFGPVAFPLGIGGGPPTIGDFDNDGRVEVAAASSDSYTVFDPDCVGAPQAATCASLSTDGILWTQVSQDRSSNATGSSVFDFEGDGQAEAIYADECFNRVYDGKTGEVLFSQWRTSCTWHEYPVIADVDGDFNSELVIPSNTNCDIVCPDIDPSFKGLRCAAGAECPSGRCEQGLCRCSDSAECGGNGFVCTAPLPGTPGAGDVCRAQHGGKTSGVLVYRDILDRWVSSRTIWNQHTYSVTNVEEDGTIPRTSSWVQNWTRPELNNYRQNVQGGLTPNAAPDLTARRVTTSLPCSSEGDLTLKVEVCNRGTQPVAAGLPVTFYEGLPADQQPICTATTSAQIDPEQCHEVSCIWVGAPANQATDVWVVADDDGSGRGTASECKEGNNSTVIPGVRCQQIE